MILEQAAVDLGINSGGDFSRPYHRLRGGDRFGISAGPLLPGCAQNHLRNLLGHLASAGGSRPKFGDDSLTAVRYAG